MTERRQQIQDLNLDAYRYPFHEKKQRLEVDWIFSDKEGSVAAADKKYMESCLFPD